MYNKGDLRIFYIEWDGEYLPVGCLTSDSFSETSETLKTTTRGDGNWSYDIPVRQSYSISLQGLVKQTLIDEQNIESIDFNTIKQLKRTDSLIKWKLESALDINISSGQGYITSISDTANVDDFISFNAEIKGYGDIVQSKKEIILLQGSLQNNL